MLREVHPAAEEKCANKSASIHPFRVENQDQCFSSEVMQALGANGENRDGDCCDKRAPYFLLLRSPLSEQSNRRFVFCLLQNVRAVREVVPFLGPFLVL